MEPMRAWEIVLNEDRRWVRKKCASAFICLLNKPLLAFCQKMSVAMKEQCGCLLVFLIAGASKSVYGSPRIYCRGLSPHGASPRRGKTAPELGRNTERRRSSQGEPRIRAIPA